jgi:hypothetical protein
VQYEQRVVSRRGRGYPGSPCRLSDRLVRGGVRLAARDSKVWRGRCRFETFTGRVMDRCGLGGMGIGGSRRRSHVGCVGMSAL